MITRDYVDEQSKRSIRAALGDLATDKVMSVIEDKSKWDRYVRSVWEKANELDLRVVLKNPMMVSVFVHQSSLEYAKRMVDLILDGKDSEGS